LAGNPYLGTFFGAGELCREPLIQVPWKPASAKAANVSLETRSVIETW